MPPGIPFGFMFYSLTDCGLGRSHFAGLSSRSWIGKGKEIEITRASP
jgi:hypothetical protein